MAMAEELLGCWREAERAEKVSLQLLLIRTTLDPEFYEHISILRREVDSSSRLLRDLYDLFPIYQSRIPIVVYYLIVILPAYTRTLKDMMIYIDNDALPAQRQWTLMVERLGEQGMTLEARFVMFVEFLVQTVRLLSRSPLYHPTTLELLRLRLLRLRYLQGIPAPPVPAQPHHAPTQPSHSDLERRHWAEKVFDEPLRKPILLHHRRASRCFGPPMTETALELDPGSRVLFKLPFDRNHVSLILYVHPAAPNVARLLCRWVDRYNNPSYSCYGVQELCIRRKGACLQLRRWDQGRAYPTLWMVAFWSTWEKMVLFHSAFGALKARCPLSINVPSADLLLDGEVRLFQGNIIDDGFEHILTILQDRNCHGIRLHAAVKNGNLKRCPVWTAFVTSECQNPKFLNRKGPHRIRLRDVQPYVFCQEYRRKHQLTKRGEWELYFISPDDASDFQDCFAEEGPEGGGTSAEDQIIEVGGDGGDGGDGSIEP